MKKLFLFAGALMISAIGFSQVSGAPTAGTAAALPGAGVGANTGLSIQNGDANKVRVRQAGTEQSVLTFQDNGDGTGGNLAKVRQTGSVQAASGFQNAAEVNQSGTENQSSTRQEGDLNNAITNQGQNDGTSTGNKAMIRQGVADQAESNYAATEQDGNYNQSNTLQTFDNSDAWTRQIGDDNKNMIVQDAGPNGTDGHEAMAYQEGDRNESAIMQSGAGGRNIAETSQGGDDNQAKQLQVTTALAGSVGNRAAIRQGNPSVGVNLTVSNAAFTEIRDVADAEAGAYWPTATGPVSIGAKAKQTQYGENNEAEIYQRSGTVGASNYAEQMQASGSGNDASIGQGHYFPGDSNNYAKQYQAGDDNRANLISSGSGHKALQDQRGDSNIANSSQLGRDNLLNVHQRGDSNAAASGQRGIGNRTLIVQHDGQSYTAAQNLNIPNNFIGSDGGNQIDVLQVGPDGNFGSDYAIDCDFEEPMNLDMNYDIPDMEIGDICPDC